MGEVSSGFGSGATGDMRVLFFIRVSSLSQGKGGHFHSLNHLTVALGEKIDVGICTIGQGTSDILIQNPFFKGHLYLTGKNFFSFKKELNEKIEEYKPDILHCFDHSSYSILTMSINQNKVIVVNKCGGPNPTEFPWVRNLILFSKENKDWFKRQNKFKNSSIYLIPNRVNKEELVKDKAHRPIIKKNAFCFVRIARIGRTYEKSIEDAIHLIEQLQAKGALVHLYIIGTIEDQNIFDELKRKCHALPITILTDNKLTKKASNLLYLADAVIATGRGIMEATAWNLPILTPAQNSNLPILVTKDNFPTFFETNFSQRNMASLNDLKSNFSLILKLINNIEFYHTQKDLSKELFSKYFDVEGAIPKYISIYTRILKKPIDKRYYFKNIKYQLKSLYHYYRFDQNS